MAKAFRSTKTFTHAQGLSCCFRQWRADSHCRFLHGYALEVKITFQADELDYRNWVMDFGGLKDIKDYLVNTFDHKLVVAQDDPMLEDLKRLTTLDVARIIIVQHVGCERFAEMVYDYVDQYLSVAQHPLVQVESVEVREHAGNSAICSRK